MQIDQVIGIAVSEEAGTVLATVQLPDGSEVTLEPARPYRAVQSTHPASFEIVVSTQGDQLASYLLQACRSIPPYDPCALSDVVTPKPGDVDCSGQVDADDALLILQRIARLVSSIPCISVAYANLDGRMDAIDAELILQLHAGLLVKLPLP